MLRAALLTLLLGLTGSTHAVSPVDIEAELRRIERLSTTAPWHESQAVLEELRPLLGDMTDDQRAWFRYHDARNRSLSGDFAGGLELARNALDAPMSPQRRVVLMRLAANIAVIARRFETAFVMLREALELIDQHDLDRFDHGVYSMASYTYTRVGELQAGIRFGRLAVDQARKFSEPRILCSNQLRLAYAYKEARRFDLSETQYRHAIENCLEDNDELTAGVAESGLADLMRMRGDREGVRALFARAIERLERVDYSSGVAEARLYRARFEAAGGNFDAVERLLRPAIEQFRQEDNSEYLAEAHQLLGQVERERGNLEAALDHYDRFMAARERHVDVERARQLAFLEVEFDVQHKEQQLALLREQARVSDLEAETRRQRARLTAVGYALVIVLVVVLVLLLLQATRDRRRFQRISRHDGLTDVLNHTHFFQAAERELQNCREQRQPFTLIVADIDYFKRVNDRHGHATGDEMLRRVAARLREVFGEQGPIGRIGGEEFAIALPQTGAAGVRPLIDRFRESLTEVREDDEAMPITMSFGVAEPADCQESLLAIRERADSALYQAKHAGRDRVMLAGA